MAMSTMSRNHTERCGIKIISKVVSLVYSVQDKMRSICLGIIWIFTMLSYLMCLFLPLIFYTAVLGNQTPAFDDLISSKFHSSTKNSTALAPLDGRSLLKSWLSPRVLTCEDPGYGLCPSKLASTPFEEKSKS